MIMLNFDQSCVNRTETVHGTLRLFPVFISPIVWNMCEHFHYISVYFKELPKEQKYYIQSGGTCSVNYYQFILSSFVSFDLNFYMLRNLYSTVSFVLPIPMLCSLYFFKNQLRTLCLLFSFVFCSTFYVTFVYLVLIQQLLY